MGTSVDKNDFPYVLPGPDDTWGVHGVLPVGELMMLIYCLELKIAETWRNGSWWWTWWMPIRAVRWLR